jgi:formate dehydrogenase subunit gamma
MSQHRILANGSVLRYTFRERIVHWVAGFSYIYLLLSGLAFWTPWMWWLALFLGGGPVARAVHPWMGLIFTAAVVYMFAIWHRDMYITQQDREWRNFIGEYVRNEEEALEPTVAVRSFQQFAPVDRFNYGQKYLFWVMFWGGIVLFATGMVLWFTEYIPWSLRFLRLISVILHPIAFLVTLGGFIIHVYMGTAVVRGGFNSVIRGEVSKAWAAYHHRMWLDKISAEPGTKK